MVEISIKDIILGATSGELELLRNSTRNKHVSFQNGRDSSSQDVTLLTSLSLLAHYHSIIKDTEVKFKKGLKSIMVRIESQELVEGRQISHSHTMYNPFKRVREYTLNSPLMFSHQVLEINDTFDFLRYDVSEHELPIFMSDTSVIQKIGFGLRTKTQEYAPRILFEEMNSLTLNLEYTIKETPPPKIEEGESGRLNI